MPHPGRTKTWSVCYFERSTNDIPYLCLGWVDTTCYSCRCPRCAGRMQLIATIHDLAVIQGPLAHLGLPGTRDDPQPPWSMTAAGSEQPALPSVTV